MVTSEIYGAHGLTRDSISLANRLQHVLHGAGKSSISKKVKPSYAQRYAHIIIKRVNKEEVKSEVKI